MTPRAARRASGSASAKKILQVLCRNNSPSRQRKVAHRTRDNRNPSGRSDVTAYGYASISGKGDREDPRDLHLDAVCVVWSRCCPEAVLEVSRPGCSVVGGERRVRRAKCLDGASLCSSFTGCPSRPLEPSSSPGVRRFFRERRE